MKLSTKIPGRLIMKVGGVSESRVHFTLKIWWLCQFDLFQKLSLKPVWATSQNALVNFWKQLIIQQQRIVVGYLWCRFLLGGGVWVETAQFLIKINEGKWKWGAKQKENRTTFYLHQQFLNRTALETVVPSAFPWS